MNKNMIINGINRESVTIYEELIDYGFEDIIFSQSNNHIYKFQLMNFFKHIFDMGLD